jgi:hypothetical protein
MTRGLRPFLGCVGRVHDLVRQHYYGPNSHAWPARGGQAIEESATIQSQSPLEAPHTIGFSNAAQNTYFPPTMHQPTAGGAHISTSTTHVQGQVTGSSQQ